MSILQKVLEVVDNDNIQNVDNVDRRKQKNNPKTTKSTTSKTLKINTLENPAQNVVNVACMREIENHLPSSSSKNKKINISPPRASNNVNKLKSGNCGQCPAAGYWDWKGPGKWCFYRAYFLGKAGHPRSCDKAKHDCPLNGG